MCIQFFKNLFSKPSIPDYPQANKILLTYAINDYPGTQNDLRGCLYDQQNVCESLPDFQHRIFSDSMVTRKVFMQTLEKAITESLAGDVIVVHYSGHGTQVKDVSDDEPDGYDEALYLYDGILIDDDIHRTLTLTPRDVTVCLLIDSCFSGSITRNNPCEQKARFVQTDDHIYKDRVESFGSVRSGEELLWVVISGCDEHQTSADALINNQWQGAFTHVAIKTLLRTYTYKQWFNAIRLYLPSSAFSQSPTLEGPVRLLDKLIFT